MRRALILVCVVLASLSMGAQTASPKWSTYKGAWFAIKYPPTFKVRPSLKSTTGQGYDSAFFKSPDGLVEFYVFSPQWNGKPTDILIKPKTETSVSKHSSTKAGVRTTSATIRAKNGSYTRSYVDVENTKENTRRVSGIKYRNQQAYNKYKADYLKFKASLIQYAD